MTDFVYLQGSDDVQKAGYNMKVAADQMTSAASYIHESLFQFLERFEQAVSALVEACEDKS
jgi:hypothetical protein